MNKQIREDINRMIEVNKILESQSEQRTKILTESQRRQLGYLSDQTKHQNGLNKYTGQAIPILDKLNKKYDTTGEIAKKSILDQAKYYENFVLGGERGILSAIQTSTFYVNEGNRLIKEETEKTNAKIKKLDDEVLNYIKSLKLEEVNVITKAEQEKKDALDSASKEQARKDKELNDKQEKQYLENGKKYLEIISSVYDEQATYAEEAYNNAAPLILDTISSINNQANKVNIFESLVIGIESAKESMNGFITSLKSFGGAVSNLMGEIANSIQNSIGSFVNLANTFTSVKDGFKDNMGKMVDDFNKGNISFKDLSDKLGKGFEEMSQKIASAVLSATAATFQMVGSLLNSISGVTQEESQKRLQVMRGTYNEDLANLNEQLKDKLITQDQYNTEKDKLDEDLRAKETAEKKKQFDSNKAFAIANVWISAATAIMGLFASLSALPMGVGFVLAGIMSGVVTGIAIAQTALIANQQPPAYAQGGTIGNTPIRMNEKGGEIAKLPDGTVIVPHDISKQIAKGVGGQGNNINVSFAGAKIANDMDLQKVTDYVSKQLAYRLRTI
jgi:hypothetical protein